MNNSSHAAPGLIRRLAAIVYDSLLLAALLLLCAAPLPLLSEEFLRSSAGHWLVRAYMLALSYVFFSWFWTHGGQTLGMRAWRLRLVSDTGGSISWSLASKRFAAAILSWLAAGLGFIWCLFDRQGLTWHDRLSKTRLRHEPKSPSSYPTQQDQSSQ